MEVTMANGVSTRDERERILAGAALIGSEVVRICEPIFMLSPLGRQFRRSSCLVQLCVEFSEKAHGVKEFPGLSLDELQE